MSSSALPPRAGGKLARRSAEAAQAGTVDRCARFVAFTREARPDPPRVKRASSTPRYLGVSFEARSPQESIAGVRLRRTGSISTLSITPSPPMDSLMMNSTTSRGATGATTGTGSAARGSAGGVGITGSAGTDPSAGADRGVCDGAGAAASGCELRHPARSTHDAKSRRITASERVVRCFMVSAGALNETAGVSHPFTLRVARQRGSKQSSTVRRVSLGTHTGPQNPRTGWGARDEIDEAVAVDVGARHREAKLCKSHRGGRDRVRGLARRHVGRGESMTTGTGELFGDRIAPSLSVRRNRFSYGDLAPGSADTSRSREGGRARHEARSLRSALTTARARGSIGVCRRVRGSARAVADSFSRSPRASERPWRARESSSPRESLCRHRWRP